MPAQDLADRNWRYINRMSGDYLGSGVPKPSTESRCTELRGKQKGCHATYFVCESSWLFGLFCPQASPDSSFDFSYLQLNCLKRQAPETGFSHLHPRISMFFNELCYTGRGSPRLFFARCTASLAWAFSDGSPTLVADEHVGDGDAESSTAYRPSTTKSVGVATDASFSPIVGKFSFESLKWEIGLPSKMPTPNDTTSTSGA